MDVPVPKNVNVECEMWNVELPGSEWAEDSAFSVAADSECSEYSEDGIFVSVFIGGGGA